MTQINLVAVTDKNGKSVIAIARQFKGEQRNFNGENFWVRGYAVSVVGSGLDVWKGGYQRIVNLKRWSGCMAVVARLTKVPISGQTVTGFELSALKRHSLESELKHGRSARWRRIADCDRAQTKYWGINSESLLCPCLLFSNSGIVCPVSFSSILVTQLECAIKFIWIEVYTNR